MEQNLFTRAIEKQHLSDLNDLDADLQDPDLQASDPDRGEDDLDDLDYKALAEQEALADNEAQSSHVNGVSDKRETSGGSGTSPSLISLPVPPDGGWGWVVCACSFMVMIILDGLLFSFGVFYMELIDYFGQGKGETALVGSTLMGTHLIFGPVTSVLVNLWDCRRVAMVGSVVATFAFVISTFAPNIPTLIFTYGFLGGVGVSMVYIPAILVVGFYFEKKRAIANGIANSGSGLGAFIYAPLCHVLLTGYGWSGALLLLAGLVLNCLLFAAMFRPLRAQRVPTETIKYDWTGDNQLTLYGKHGAPSGGVISHSTGDFRSDFRHVHGSAPSVPGSMLPSRVSAKNNSFYHIHAPAAPPGDKSRVNSIHSATNVTVSTPMFPKTVTSPLQNRRFLDVRCDSHRSIFQSGESLAKPLYRKDIFYTGSVNKLPEYKSNPASLDFTASMLRIPNRENEADLVGPFGCHNIQDTLRSLLGLSLLKSPIFILIIVSSCMWTTHSSVLTILPEHAVHCGLQKHEASLLVSVIGMANILGRLTAGLLVDRFDVDVLKLDAAARLVGGLVNIGIVFTSQLYLFLVEAVVFGISMGVWVSLRPISLVELLGLEKLTNAFGLLAMFQGIAFCVGPPVAGILFDVTGSYRIPFILCACAFILSGLLCLPMRRLVRWEVRQKNPMRACFGCEESEHEHITSSREIVPAPSESVITGEV